LEVPTIYKAYFLGLSFREYPHEILESWIRILDFPGFPIDQKVNILMKAVIQPQERAAWRSVFPLGPSTDTGVKYSPERKTGDSLNVSGGKQSSNWYDSTAKIVYSVNMVIGCFRSKWSKYPRGARDDAISTLVFGSFREHS